MKVFLVRHVECKANTADVILGAGESPLTKKGRAQAKALARFFANKKIDVIYSSPLSRAVDTAKAIAGTVAEPVAGQRKEIIVDARLIERSLGLLQGLCMADALSAYPHAFKKNNLGANTKLIFHPPGGETWPDARKRMKAFFAELLQTNSKNVVVVSHSDAIRSVLGYWLGKSLQEYFLIPQANACVNEIKLTARGVKVIKVNYVKHLAEKQVNNF